MSASITAIHPSIRLFHHLMLACLLVLMSFSPLKNGIPRSSMAHISTTTVTAFTLALEAAYATSVGDLQRSTVASVEGKLMNNTKVSIWYNCTFNLIMYMYTVLVYSNAIPTWKLKYHIITIEHLISCSCLLNRGNITKI